MNSTPGTFASTMRLTALTPAPPTPTTRITGWCGCPLPTGSYSGSSRPYRGASGAGSLRRTLGSSLKTRFNLSGADSLDSPRDGSADPSCDSAAAPAGGVGLGSSPAAREDEGPSSATGPAGPAPGPSGGSAGASSAVERNRSERGPSRMLARLRRLIRQNLLGQVSVVVRGAAARIVLEDAGAFHGRLGELDRLFDPRLEDEVAEVLFEDLDRLLGVDGPRVEHGRQDALDLDVGVEVLLDHPQRVLELDQPAHRQILALDGDDHLARRRQRVDRQQPEAGRRVDADEVVVAGDLFERFLERALAADLGAHRDLGAGQVDRGDGDVDLALLDDLRDRHVVDEHVVEALLHLVGIDPLAHRQVALRVQVDAQHPVPGLGKRHGKVQGRGRLRHPTLLVGERDDLSMLRRHLDCRLFAYTLVPRWSN